MCDANHQMPQKPNGAASKEYTFVYWIMLSVCDHQCMLAVVCIRKARMHWGVSAQHATKGVSAQHATPLQLMPTILVYRHIAGRTDATAMGYMREYLPRVSA